MTKEENEKRLEYLKNIVLNMPEKPGSYQYYDDLRENGGTIIYVGKAKNLGEGSRAISTKRSTASRRRSSSPRSETSPIPS